MGIALVKRLMNKLQTQNKERCPKEVIFFEFLLFVLVYWAFKLNICQFLRSLKTGALGNCLTRHGLASALPSGSI